MAANVTIHHGAWSDPRVHYLAQLIGCNLTDTMGRLARLWSRCTELQTDRPGRVEIRAAMGDARGDQLLIDCGLGEVGSDGDVRVRGTDGRIGWYADAVTNRAKGGKARAANAPRDERGRLLPSNKNAGSSNLTSNESSNPASLERSRSQGPADAGLLGPASPADSSRSNLDPRSEDPEREKTRPAQPSGLQSAGEISPPSEKSANAIRSLRAIGDRGIDSLNAIRARVAKKFGWGDVRPLHPQDRAREDLRQRLSECGDPVEGQRQLDHVLRIAELEAIAKRTVEFLGGGIFTDRSWSKKLAMRDADAMRAVARGTEPAPTMRIKRDDDAPPPIGLSVKRDPKPEPPKPEGES